MPPISALWTGSPRLLAEHLVPVPEPLALALAPGEATAPAAVAARAARALLDIPEMAPKSPPWLASHQVPALNRLRGVLDRYGGALLADAVGLGKSYIALALAIEMEMPVTLVVPAVLVPQWRTLLFEKHVEAEVLTHESLSRAVRLTDPGREPGAPGIRNAKSLVVVDEAHRFRNAETIRYRALAELCVGSRVLLVTATPVHNRIADLFHLFRLFLRDDALTALGLGSLARAARGEYDETALGVVAPRLVVARSRHRVGNTIAFPARAPASIVRIGAAPDELIATLVAKIRELPMRGPAAALLRLVLLRRLASSVTAFRSTLGRYRAFLELKTEARSSGRRLGAREFQRLFPRNDDPALQLTLLPLMLDPGESIAAVENVDAIAAIHALAKTDCDPKADALNHMLSGGDRTIVFTTARETARHLQHRLCRAHRVAAVSGSSGWFGLERTHARDVLATFAPLAQGAPIPPLSLQTDVLIATDLASEGLNLQDAARVIHYDLPWSPARLAQRVGRIDRLGSPHQAISTVTFLPPWVLEEAMGLERRLSAKLIDQERAGAAQGETTAGALPVAAPFDWCDRLQALTTGDASLSESWAAASGRSEATVLVVQLGNHAEAIVVENGIAQVSHERATELLEDATTAPGASPDRGRLDAAIRCVAPLVRERLAALQAARWRAEDRDRLARRLVPWVLTAGRRAARSGDARLLGRLDSLISRLTLGMTAGEEFTLRALVERRASLAVRDLLAWHERLPPLSTHPEAPEVALVAAIAFSPPDA